MARGSVATIALLAGLVLLVASCEASHVGADLCGDQDGISGGAYAFAVTVTDGAFSPTILKAQDHSEITVKLTNAGTQAHDLVVDCIPTPNENHCPPISCFPDEAAIGPLQPGESVTVTFDAPNPEGIYAFHCDVDGHDHGGQFVIQ